MSSFNRKTKSPGWKSGGHWVECQRTGRVVRNYDIRKEWTGLLVAKEEWEPRHPQEFIRGIVDNPSAQGYKNSETTGTDVGLDYGEAHAGLARARSARTGYTNTLNDIPLGSFNSNTL